MVPAKSLIEALCTGVGIGAALARINGLHLVCMRPGSSGALYHHSNTPQQQALRSHDLARHSTAPYGINYMLETGGVSICARNSAVVRRKKNARKDGG